MERVRPIEINDSSSGNTYIIEFDRATIMYAERQKFSIADIEKYPLTVVSDLFFYGFRKHHPNVTKQQANEILDGLGGVVGLPDGFIERLAALYMIPYESVKNSSLTVNF